MNNLQVMSNFGALRGGSGHQGKCHLFAEQIGPFCIAICSHTHAFSFIPLLPTSRLGTRACGSLRISSLRDDGKIGLKWD